MNVRLQSPIHLNGTEEPHVSPVVSVIIPVYNRGRLLRRAIVSVLSQTFQAFELIIVDDASPEDLRSVVGEFKDARIRYIRHEHNLGGAAARNTGISHSKAEFIAFLDSDDEWLPDKTVRQLETLRKDSSAAACFCLWNNFNDDTLKLGRDVGPKELHNLLPRLLARNCLGPTSGVMIRRSCFNVISDFDVGIKQSQDWDLWLRIVSRFPIVACNEVLLRYHVHSQGRISKNIANTAESHYKMWKKFERLFTEYPRSASIFSRSLATEFAFCGDLREARRFYRISIERNPWQILSYASMPGTIGPRAYASWQKKVDWINIRYRRMFPIRF